MSVFTVREVPNNYNGKPSIGYEVISPSGKRMFLGYSQRGNAQYQIGNRNKAQRIADALTRNANVRAVNYDKFGKVDHRTFSRKKAQKKHIPKYRETLAKFGIDAKVTAYVSGMKVMPDFEIK